MAAETVEQGGAEASFLDDVLMETRASSPQVRDIYKRGISELLKGLVSTNRTIERVDKTAVDGVIAQIDEQLSKQLDEIMHDPKMQKIESAWRGLKMVVDRTDFRAKNEIQILNLSKEDLIEDFDDAPEITESGYYKKVYTAEYGQFGGEPYGTIVANYEFSNHPQDISLLQSAAAVSAMSHAPFIASVGPKMFGVESVMDVAKFNDIDDVLSGPEYIKWNSFRETEDSRYVGLTFPRFLLRLPYGPDTSPVKAFNYQEEVRDDHDKYLWGNTSFAFATRLTESFSKYGWCPNIIGPQSGGSVYDLPVHVYDSMGDKEAKIPTEILIPERLDVMLSEAGFIGLTMRKGSDNACFFAADSVQKPKTFGQSEEGKAAETNFKLGTKLPYIYVVSRLAHYLKVLQREQIGSWKERSDLERELNEWIKQYVVDMDNPGPTIRSKRPLRQAQVMVNEVPGEPGLYKVDLKVRPHFKYLGAQFTLSLVGKLDKS